MKIILMRHAAALSREESGVQYDAERPLAGLGREQARRVGAFLGAIDCRPSAIVCSPFVRTQETAMGVNQALPRSVAMHPLSMLAPGSGPEELLRAAVHHGEAGRQWLLAVMHEPDVGFILGHWLNEDQPFPLRIRQGDVFALDVRIDQGHSDGELVFYYSPAALGGG